MRFEAWRRRHRLSRAEVARALRWSHTNLNRLATGQPPTLRHAAILHRLSRGEIGYEDMLPEAFFRAENSRIWNARKELGLD